MDALIQDLRYAWRTLARSPGFALLSVLCLALGIGVNSTIFSVVDTVAIRPLPFKDAADLVVVQGTHLSTGIDEAGVSWLDLQDYKTGSRTFAEVASMQDRSMTVTDRDESERFLGSLATSNLFPMLGVDPILGRHFRGDEDQPGAARVVLLGYGLWQRRYLSDPAIVGRSITIDGLPHTVVGVMPRAFQFPQLSQLWTPLAPVQHASRRDQRFLDVIARLAPGASLDDARADLAGTATRLSVAYLENRGWAVTAVALRDVLMPEDVRLVVFTMMGAVSLVLLIACANVANLLLARATVRQREIAVRAALGAGRGRIARQLVTESVLLALASVPVGVGLAYVGLQWLTASIPPQDAVPYYIDWSMSWRVVFYAGGVAVLTGLLFGLVPAVHALGPDLHRSLKDGGRGAGAHATRNRLRNGLVVAEIALSLVLLVGAALFVRSFLQLQSASVGVDMAPLMTMRFLMAGEQYKTPEAMTQRVEDIVRRVEVLPGVVSAFGSNFVPIAGGGGGGKVVADGVSVESGREPEVSYFGVTPHALLTLSLPLLAGRDFSEAEGASRSGVAIVNPDFAKRVWSGQADIVGRRFRLLDDPAKQWITVVGVVPNFSPYDVGDDPLPSAFLPYPYMPVRNTGITIKVAGGLPASITAAVRGEIRRSDPLMPIFDERAGEEIRQTAFWDARLFGYMFSIFGGIALLLASIGVYGVLSYAVAQRTQEIGVRMALGASRENVLRLVLGQGARLAGLGILIGLAGAALVTRLVESLLYNVSTTDTVSFVATALFLAFVAVLASYIPARRATAVDPLVALRTE
jgi:putative ABC transport system permease protein